MNRFSSESLEPAPDPPTLTFEETAYSLFELLNSHLLPVVVQYGTIDQPAPFNDLDFDLTQPLLLYKKRNIQKVSARSLCIHENKYVEVGESLLIPEDYKGWFAVLQRITGSVTADDNVPHFKNIEELADSNTERFLIGGTKKINGLQILDRSESHLNHKQVHFFPGDTLTREKIYYGDTKKRTRLFRKPKYITEKFLMCRDETDREILLPFAQAGIFYQISHRSGKAHKNVMQMSDIVARKLTPRIIKLVFGRFPVTPCSFTGLMKAESSHIETSVIAATVVNKNNVLLEMPVSSDIKLQVAETNDELRLNPCFRNAMGMCAEKASTYMRNIKVCYNFTADDTDEDSAFDDIDNQIAMSYRPYENTKFTSFDKSDADMHQILNNHGNKPIPQIRYSEDLGSDVSMRPTRSVSTGRMSFCFGNSYLTVPMYESDHKTKRNSGNNNSTPIETYTTRRGSRLSFNGKFFEEDVPDESFEDDALNEKIPPPLPCTYIGSYVNTSPYINTTSPTLTHTRRSSTQAPEMSPPPLPHSTPSLSANTSGVSGSLSSISDENNSNRASSDSCEYDIPKTDPNDSKQPTITSETENKRVRRPSTFTFSEGCLPADQRFKRPSLLAISDTNDTIEEDDSPIYENIATLMELVTKLENRDEEFAPFSEFPDFKKAERHSNLETIADVRSEDEDVEENTGLRQCVCEITESKQKPKVMTKPTSRRSGAANCYKNTECPIQVTEMTNQTTTENKITIENCETFNELVNDFDNVIDATNPTGCDTTKEDINLIAEESNENSDVTERITSPTAESNCNRWCKALDNSRKSDGSSFDQCLLHGTKRYTMSEDEPLETWTVEQLSDKLRDIGIKDASIQQIHELCVSGAVLAAVVNSDTTIRECLQGVNLVDQQKISMFIRGWRPNDSS